MILGELQTNCYFLTDHFKCILIDPADAADFLLEKLQRENLELVGLVATHGHFDHILAVGEIQLSYNVPLYLDKKDDFLVKRMNKTAAHFLGHNPHAIDPHIFRYFPERSSSLTISSFSFQLFHTPGHTPGSVCLYFPDEQVVFTGDTLFKAATGRYDFAYGNKEDLKDSLQQLRQLPEETIVYPGHGELTTIGSEI